MNTLTQYLTPSSLAYIIAGAFAIKEAVKRFKTNAVLAEKEREDQIQARIGAAVTAEQDRIDRMKEVADEWKSIATSRAERNQLLSDELAQIHAELKDLRGKYEELLKLYAASQTALAELQKGNR